jgi:hypothetical protein
MPPSLIELQGRSMYDVQQNSKAVLLKALSIAPRAVESVSRLPGCVLMHSCSFTAVVRIGWLVEYCWFCVSGSLFSSQRRGPGGMLSVKFWPWQYSIGGGVCFPRLRRLTYSYCILFRASCSIIAVIQALESHIVLEHVTRFVPSSIIALDTHSHVITRDV